MLNRSNPSKKQTCISIVCTISFSLSSAYSLAEGRCHTPAATIESIEGKVEWRENLNSDWQPAGIGSVFCYGNQVKVVQYRAALRLENNTLVRLEENSVLNLIAPEQGFWIELLQGAGHFLSRTPKSFSVKAPYVNAAVDGTEFIVTADTKENSVSVIEGQVTVSNAANVVVLHNNQKTSAPQNQTLTPITNIKLKDSAVWALYFPALFSANNSRADVQVAIANSQYLTALDLLMQQPTNAEQLALAASIYLALGDADAAQAKLNDAFKIDSTSVDAQAVNAFMTLIKTDNNSAFELTNRLVAKNPTNTNALLVHSFVLQSKSQQSKALQFAKQAYNSLIDTSKIQKAVTLANLAIVAHYAEVLINNQRNRQAAALISEALELVPSHSQLNTLAGFIALNQLNIDEAKSHFSQAIATDSNNALAHFGIALTYINQRKLIEGQEALELAVLLDPTNSLFRSYLGKTYFEEQKMDWASIQYELAKKLDPNDPTPWFYEAHLLKQQGKLQETLVNLETSKRLNDNRAVYRSRFFLDNDIAAKNANQTNVYLDLNIEQIAKAQAGLAVTDNHDEFANHRAASLAYRQDNNAQVLQKNEATLTRLLQPIDAQPLPVGVGQPAIIAYDWLSPNKIGTNEYGSLFSKRGISGDVTGYSGTQKSQGYDWQTQAIGQTISANVGQYKYGSDGFSENNDFNIDYREANIHVQPAQPVTIMAHLNKSVMMTGDISNAVDSDMYDNSFRKNEESKENTLGTKIQLSPDDSILGIYSEYNISGNVSNEFSPFPGLIIESFISNATKQHRKELQWVKTLNNYTILIGHSNENVLSVGTPQDVAFDPSIQTLAMITDSHYSNSYFRFNSTGNSKFKYLLGAGSVKWSNAANGIEGSANNHEAGLLYYAMPNIYISAASWRKTSEYLPAIGSLGSNFIYAIDTTNHNTSFNKQAGSAVNISWISEFSTLIYEVKKTTNTDDIGINDTLFEKQSINQLSHELSSNIPVFDFTSITASYEYKNTDTPISYATNVNLPLGIKDQNLLLSLNQQFGGKITVLIEWILFKQQQTLIDENTKDEEVVTSIKNNNTAHQTNAKLRYKIFADRLNLQLTANNLFNDETPIDNNRIQRNSQSILPTALAISPQRSATLSINYQF